MKVIREFVYSLLIVVFLISCADEDPRFLTSAPSAVGGGEWLIDQDLVFDGGPGKDGIPSVDNPKFTNASDVDFLSGNDLILGVRVGDDIHAYPHPILDWHEIVNDEIGGLKYALTYCPLTGTGAGGSRRVNGRETTFGVSGLLFDSNLMPYDRTTNSTWSQQRLQCVNGENIGEVPEIVSLVETTWNAWRAAYPNSMVLNTDTGFGRNYSQYPYGDFRTNNERLLFPVTNVDDRLPSKERVLGVINGTESIAYPLALGTSNSLNGPQLITDVINGKDLAVIRDEGHNLVVAFEVNNAADYKSINGSFPFVIEGPDGEQYDILGFNRSGDRQLSKPTQFVGYWFSWGTFYPNITISSE